jgi:hypothetical protein
MAIRKKSAKKGLGGTRSVTLKPEQFRSMILDKLRLDIDAKRAAYEQAKKLRFSDLGTMSYYKMKYWKMKYWKKGVEMMAGQDVINPVRSLAARRMRKKQMP